MAEIVNLRRARKAKARAERTAEADANRVQHGVSKADRDVAKSKRTKDSRELDAHKIEE